MTENEQDIQTIDEYILLFPPEVQKILHELRLVIKESAPEAKEKMSWRMPTFDLHGNLVHFAAYSRHIGFYPGVDGIAAFQGQIEKYKHSKGAVQFPINQPLPFDLIREIVRYRVDENVKEASLKSARTLKLK